MHRLFINKIMKPMAVCTLLLGTGSVVQGAQIPFDTNFREIFTQPSPNSQTTLILKNNNYFPMIIDWVSVQSDSVSPVFLQVTGPGLIIPGGKVLVGEYPFLPKPSSEDGKFIISQPMTIVILPGDSIRGFSPSSAVYSISVNGHYNFPPLPYFYPNY